MVLDYGIVLSVKDGVVRASGLNRVAAGEMVQIENIFGMVLNLENNIVAIVVFGNDSGIKAGDKVIRTKEQMYIKVGDGVLGRVLMH